ncbi:hypothetical protein DXG01_009578 [Tephrocybe rancida]|nr:hypothetical protein DXG01_009578 [Tephrocybe rancida]
MPPSARTRTAQPLRRQNAFIYIPGLGVFPPEASIQYYGLSPLDEPQLAVGVELPRQAVTQRIGVLLRVGRRFARTVHAYSRISTLILNGPILSAADAFTPEYGFSHRV